MQLTQEDLDEFKAIYQREFDTELTDAEALEVAQSALNDQLRRNPPRPRPRRRVHLTRVAHAATSPSRR